MKEKISFTITSLSAEKRKRRNEKISASLKQTNSKKKSMGLSCGGRYVRTEDTRKKQSEKMKEKMKNRPNHTKGTIWICNKHEGISKRVNSNDPIPVGWEKGRILKK